MINLIFGVLLGENIEKCAEKRSKVDITINPDRFL